MTLRFRGREITHQELGMRLLERVRDDLTDVSVVKTCRSWKGAR